MSASASIDRESFQKILTSAFAGQESGLDTQSQIGHVNGQWLTLAPSNFRNAKHRERVQGTGGRCRHFYCDDL